MMNLFLIILSLILFHGNNISGLDAGDLNGIDVLQTLKSEVPNCQLRDFVKTDKDYEKLSEDLAKYCTASDTTKQNALICRMLAYELQKACGLSSKARPSQALYSATSTQKEICNKKKVVSTSEWILNKITNNEKTKIDMNANDLCLKVTSDENTLRLAKFFYKIAPRIREDDQSKQNKDGNQSNANDKSIKEVAVEAVKNAKDTVVDAAQAVKKKAETVMETVANKTGEAVQGAKDTVGSALNSVKETAKQAVQGVQDKVDQTIDTVKETGKQVADKVQDKTGQAVDAVKETGKQAVDAVKETGKLAVDKAQDKTGQAVDTVKETGKQVADKVQDKTGQAVDAAKETGKQIADTVQDKTGQAVDAAKENGQQIADKIQDKTGQGVDAVKETGKQVADKVQDKTGQGVDAAKETGKQVADKVQDKAGQGVDAVKEAGKQAAEKVSDKVDQAAEDAKGKVAGGQNVFSDMVNKTGGIIQTGIDKVKQVGDSLAKTIGDGTKLLPDAAKEVLPKTGDKQQVLDLNNNGKTETETKKDQANTNVETEPKKVQTNPNDDDDNDDGGGDTNKPQAQDTQQAGQISKPDLPGTKVEEPIDETKTSDLSNQTPIDNSNPDQPPESGKQAQGPKAGSDDDEGADDYDDGSRKQFKEQQELSDKKEDSPSIDANKPKVGDDETISKDNQDIAHDSDEPAETGIQTNDNADTFDQGNQPDGMVIRKPNEQDKSGKRLEMEDKVPPGLVIEPPKARQKTKQRERYSDDDGWSGNFVTYFLLFTLFVVVGYLVLHNKNKVLGLLIEGCRRDRSSHGRRTGGSSSSTRYQRLSQSS